MTHGYDRPDWLDEQFPLGDGTADTAVTARCPHCGELIDIIIDPGGGALQEYVEDCEVCCRPWRVHLRYRANGRAEVSLESLNE